MTEDKEIFNFEETIKFRPRCLYQYTCLHLKQKTRECKDCIHYKEYWREVVEKERKERIKRLEQENKDFEILAKSLYKRIEELEKENEALAFRERLYKADYEASEQENKELKEYNKRMENQRENYYKEYNNYRSALEEIRKMVTSPYAGKPRDVLNIINEVLQ